MKVLRLPQFPSSRSLTSAFAAVLILLLIAGPAWGQSAAPQQPSTPQQPNQPATPAQPAQPPTPPSAQTPNSPNSQSGSAQTQLPDQPEQQTRITKAQAKELFRSVDEILQFVSEDSGLPIEHKVKRNLITRESVEKYVNKRMKDDKDTKRLEQSRLVLQKFGLLPPGYDLHAELLRLMAEQVAAYYDPKTKSVNLLDWVAPDVQKPILAHELTHALQDQKIGLENWEDAGAKDDTPLPDKQEYTTEEAQAARQCVTEGQAMVTMFDYSLAPYGKNILTAPDAVAAMRTSMTDNRDSPIFGAAPMYLKESLLMPYTFGLDFERTVLADRGKEVAFVGTLENPPVDTRQIMQPETYLLHQVVAEPMIPDLDQLVAPAYERVDFGSMGEFDVYLLAKQYGANDPENYYPHWRGGYYFAAHQKTAPKDQIAMLYYSKWDSPDTARLFAKLYADYLPKRYKSAVLHHPVAGNGAEPQSLWVFDTNEGQAVLELHDDQLLIMEGFDEATREKARQVYFFGMTLPAPPTKAKS